MQIRNRHHCMRKSKYKTTKYKQENTHACTKQAEQQKKTTTECEACKKLQSQLSVQVQTAVTQGRMTMYRTYSTLSIQPLLLQLLTARLDGLRNVLLCHGVRIETLHHRNVLQWIPLQHPLLYRLPVIRQFSIRFKLTDGQGWENNDF